MKKKICTRVKNCINFPKFCCPSEDVQKKKRDNNYTHMKICIICITFF